MNNDSKILLQIIAETMKSIHQKTFYTMNDKQLYPGQPKLLSIIKLNEGITQKELATKNLCTPATITGMLNKLEANHYVKRVPDEADKRVLRVYLTTEGRCVAEQAESYMTSLMEQLFDGFTEEELQILIRLSSKMKNNISNNGKEA